ncbi:MAG: hypothetical protein AB7K24_30245 [Gemmataceae bacterium]
MRPQNPATAQEHGLTVPDPASELGRLLKQVENHLRRGDVDNGLECLARARSASPWALNATAVCFLRKSEAARAVDILRRLVLGGSGFSMRTDVPVAFRSNFAIALLIDGNTPGCLSTLHELRDDHSPGLERLRKAVADWKAGLSWWQKILFCLGGSVSTPIKLDGEIGEV